MGAVLPATTAAAMAVPGVEEPVLVTFKNSSSHAVRINIISTEIVTGSHDLGPKQELELKVQFGYTVQLEYNPCPKKTTLSPMGSVNELNRTVSLRDDGGNIFIQEKFSGARKQTQKRGGTRSVPGSVISTPEELCNDKPARKADPDQPQGKLKNGGVNIKGINSRMDGMDKLKKTRVEDPAKPAPKIEKAKEKVKKADKKSVDKKGKEK